MAYLGRRVFFVGMAAATASAGCAVPPVVKDGKAPGRYVETIQVNGVPRETILRIPKTEGPRPLVIVLHGWTASGAMAEQYTGMAEEGERRGYVTMFPDGLGKAKGWNAGFIDLTGQKPDDIAFIRSLIEYGKKEAGVDPSRIYICGHSNGAFMAYAAGSALSKQIAGIGAVAGTIGIQEKVISAPESPVPAMIIHGKLDSTVAYESTSQALLKGVSAPESAKWWANKNGIKGEPVVTESGDIRTEQWRSSEGMEVVLVSLNKGRHDWPGGLTRSGPERESGANAAKLLLDFFDRHRLKN